MYQSSILAYPTMILGKSAGGTGSGVSDHGLLTGLLDDDHPQYSLVSGTRPFTGTVAGVDPSSAQDLTTKSYVDSLVNGLTWVNPVLDKDLSTPPGTPSTGDRYIVASGGTGAWSGHDNDIAEWNGTSWSFTTAVQGLASYVTDETVDYQYNGTEWVMFGSTQNHGSLSGLLNDDHTQYALLAGRSGGQILNGGSSAGDSLTLVGNSVDSNGVRVDSTGDVNIVYGSSIYTSGASNAKITIDNRVQILCSSGSNAEHIIGSESAFEGQVTIHPMISGSSGQESFLTISPYISQSGTAGYAAINVAITESSTGSGTSNIIKASVGGTQTFSVLSNGAFRLGADSQSSSAYKLLVVTGDGNNDALVTFQNTRTTTGQNYALQVLGGTNTTDYCLVARTKSSQNILELKGSQDVILNSGALATNATSGFFHLASMPGTPIGTPTTWTGRVPITYDSTNNSLYVYNGGSWHEFGTGGSSALTLEQAKQNGRIISSSTSSAPVEIGDGTNSLSIYTGQYHASFNSGGSVLYNNGGNIHLSTDGGSPSEIVLWVDGGIKGKIGNSSAYFSANTFTVNALSGSAISATFHADNSVQIGFESNGSAGATSYILDNGSSMMLFSNYDIYISPTFNTVLFDTSGNQVLGYQSSLANSAVSGFLFIRKSADWMTGTPTSYSGSHHPMCYVGSRDRLAIYNSAYGWRYFRPVQRDSATTTVTTNTATLVSISIPNNAGIMLEVNIFGRRSGGDKKCGFWRYIFGAYHDGTSYSLLPSSMVSPHISQDDMSLVNPISVSIVSGSIHIDVTGDATSTIDWGSETMVTSPY